MIDWTWNRKEVSPQEILSAAATLSTQNRRIEVELIPDWIPSETYLMWALSGLTQNDQCGWDAAISYAKRAACRQIDALMIYNHLDKFAGKNYPEKIGMLSEVGLDIPDIVRQLVIDPRNHIEHGYKACTSQQAKQAVELAKLFLGATSTESSRKALISRGWSVDYSRNQSDAPGNKFDHIKFSLSREHPPTLLIETVSQPHQVMMTYPKDEELLVSSIGKFSRPEAIELARLLREDTPVGEFSNHWLLDSKEVAKLKEDLKL